jgi:hypothetical protein
VEEEDAVVDVEADVVADAEIGTEPMDAEKEEEVMPTKKKKTKRATSTKKTNQKRTPTIILQLTKKKNLRR